MSIHSFIVLCAILCVPAHGKVLRHRGNDSIALYWNRTSISTSSFASDTSLLATPTLRVTDEPPQSHPGTSLLATLTSRATEEPPYPYSGTSTGIRSSDNGYRASVLTSSIASNASLLATPTSRVTEEPPYPYPSAATGIRSSENGRPRPTEQVPVRTPPSKNSTGPDCTVNIGGANIDWWYAATYQYGIAALTSVRANDTYGQSYLQTIPITATFDVQSALETDYAFTTSESYDSEWGWTWTNYVAYIVTPSAAITSIISRTGAAVPLPTDSFVPATDVYLYDVGVDNLAPATAAITGAPDSTFVATSATPFLYFTAYEVESAVVVTADDGRVGSSVTTQTFKLPNVLAYPYWLKGIEDYATATGVIPAEFLQGIPQSACSAGNFEAIVTVLIVVDLIYINRPIGQPFLVHIESSATGFEQVATDDPQVIILDTAKPTPRPTPTPTPRFTPPIIEHTAIGFSSSIAAIKPAVQETAVTLTSAGDNVHNAGSGISQGVVSPEQTTRVTVGTIGTVPVVVIGPSSVVVVGSQTLQPGGPAITVGGQPVFLPSSATAIVVGGITSGLPQVLAPTSEPRPPPILTIGSSTLTGNAATQFFIAPGQTLTPGGTVAVDGTIVSLAPSASFIVIGGTTQILPTAAPAVTSRPEIVIGSSTITANPGDPGAAPTFIISGTTLAPGQVRTIDSTVVSLAPSGSFIVIGGSTQTLPTAVPTITAPPEIVVGSSTITANTGNPGDAPTFVVSGQTLVPDQVITLDGTTISLGPSGSFVVVDGATSTLTNPAAAQITAPPLTIGNVVFTALPGQGTTYIVGTHTLTPGGAITVADTTISLSPGATALVINGRTTLISAATTQAPIITNPPLLTIGSQTFTAAPGTGTSFLIGFETLTLGGTITVDGTTIILAPGATELTYGSSGSTTSTALFPAPTTESLSSTGGATATSGALSGATPTNGGAAATTSFTGAGWSVNENVGLESWGVTLVMGILGLWAW